ncbi:MAG TPA: sigma-54 dependent transcriptional regulator [Thermoanaerobaculia bacterium]|nr:sigma-54 dependent transcriptional regulator [Thermoanaerobaculia bacterium]
MDRILIVEDKESLAKMLQETLSAEKIEADIAHSAEQAERRLTSGQRYSVVLTDLRLPGRGGIDVLRQVKEIAPECPVIIMTGYGTIDEAVEAMKLGAWDFIQKPIDTDHLLFLIERCREHTRLRFENLLLKEEFQKRHAMPAIVGEDVQMKRLSTEIQKVAGTDATVLLQGESGTGKELFARAIHQLSPRRDRAFVAINCAAMPETLIENELFGHERGAYTGASSRQMGKFELADSGTLFLDEIGELGFGVQSKLLRVLQERRFERIGGTATIDVDVRVICATNRELKDEVKMGRFREDLFFRVHVFPITIPPLRERPADFDPLIDFFLQKFSRELGKKPARLSDDARSAIRRYPWPGNIRELENCLERAVILCDRDMITPEDLNLSLGLEAEDRDDLDLSGSLSDVVDRTVRRVERAKIREVMRVTSSRAETAEHLGIGYRTLLGKIREYGLDEEPTETLDEP